MEAFNADLWAIGLALDVAIEKRQMCKSME
jgi:hypothetical protein